MKWIDKIRLTWHSLMQHKTKMILTACIIFIIGLLAMGISCIAVSFVRTMNQIYQDEIEKDGITITYQNTVNITDLEYRKLDNITEAYQSEIKSVSGYAAGFTCFDFRFSSFDFVNTALAGTNAIYLNESYQPEYQTGDSFVKNDNSFIIAGFFPDSELDSFIDLSYAQKNLNGLSAVWVELLVLDDYDKTIDNLKRVYYEYSIQELNPACYSCLIMDKLEEAHNLSILVISFSVILFVITILISMGYIMNSIYISVDDNRELLKLLEILGLEKKGTFQILLMECFFSIIIGVALAYVGLFALNALLKKILSVLMSLIAPSLIQDTSVIQLSYPIYIPILCLGGMLVFTVLFSLISYKRISGNYRLTLLGRPE